MLLHGKFDEKCVQYMLPKWEKRLGRAQEFMSTHCFAMSEPGRIEFSVQALLQNSTLLSK